MAAAMAAATEAVAARWQRGDGDGARPARAAATMAAATWRRRRGQQREAALLAAAGAKLRGSLGAHARGIHRAHRGTSRTAHFNASQLRKVLCSFRLLTVSKDISAIAAAPRP